MWIWQIQRLLKSAIYKIAGIGKLLEKRKKIGHFLSGEAAITEAVGFNAKYMIYTSGSRWMGGTKGEEECLCTCYEKALHLAKDYGCESVTFSLSATGSYGFPQELEIQIAVDTFISFSQENDIEITLVVFVSEEVRISGKLMEAVASFIDDGYIKMLRQKKIDVEDCHIVTKIIRKAEQGKNDNLY